MYRRTLLGGLSLGLVGALAGCATPFVPDDVDRTPSVPTRTADSPLPPPPTGTPLGYTHLRPDGNRLVGGTGSLPDAEPVDLDLDGTPEWIVGVSLRDRVLLAVVTGAGAQGVSVVDGDVSAISLGLDAPPGPPLLVGGGDVRFAPAFGSPATHPVPTARGWASVTTDGVVRLPGGENPDVGALPDARLVGAAGRLYVLAGRTTAYAHGVLGDDVEARSVAILTPPSGLVAELTPPSGVIEGIAPIVADVDDDGEREVVVTASDSEQGARLVAMPESGGDAMAGPPVGTEFRWRHQLAVGPFGPDGETEIAAVKTPHIGGTAEFYRARDGRLELVASRRGYSTHSIGSRNLDNAVAGDLDGDGRVELLLPDDPHRHLAGLQRVEGGDRGVEEAWRLPLGGQLTSNLCAVPRPEGVVVAAGREDALRVWPA